MNNLSNFRVKKNSSIYRRPAWKSKQSQQLLRSIVYRDCIWWSIDRVNYLCLPCKQTDARGENDEDETRKERDTLMTRLWPRIEHCALESVTKRNATLLVLNACLKLGIRVWTRRKMGGKVGLICGSCWSGKYSMYIIFTISRFSIYKSYILNVFPNYFYSTTEFTRRASCIYTKTNINKNKICMQPKNKKRVFFSKRK